MLDVAIAPLGSHFISESAFMDVREPSCCEFKMALKAFLKRQFPATWNTLRATRKLAALVPRIYGFEPRDCVMCGYHGKFLAEIHFPDIFTYDAICPRCGSLPRNRLLKLALEDRGMLNAGARLLHFAPEANVRQYVEPRVGLYRTADLYAKGVDLRLNIEAIDQPDASWDLIICSHVLEHVDHRKALKELHRILAPGGILLALFPIVEAWPHDYEAAADSVPAGPRLAFRQGKSRTALWRLGAR